MASSAHKIYRGIDPEKKTVSNLKVAGAYLPGTFCSASSTTLTQATTAKQALYLLSNREFMGQDIADAYASGDTAVAFEPWPGDRFMGRFAAATYTYNQELTVGASGRLAAAASGDAVIGFYRGSGVALSAGEFDEFIVANSYAKA
ncbi:MAG: hypothetical protein RL535_985 [Pseudomonadota bacterium]|jgi:hypothetical protein